MKNIMILIFDKPSRRGADNIHYVPVILIDTKALTIKSPQSIDSTF